MRILIVADNEDIAAKEVINPDLASLDAEIVVDPVKADARVRWVADDEDANEFILVV